MASKRTLVLGLSVALACVATGCGPHAYLKDYFRANGGFAYMNPPSSLEGPGTIVQFQRGGMLIICARANARGVIGVTPEAELYVAKVIRGDESDAQSVAVGIRWMVSQGVHVLNMSLTAEKSYPPIRRAVTKALEAGCFLVAAAGNEPGGVFTGSTVRYPARYEGVIAVGAVALASDDATLPLRERVNVSGLSATGPELDLVAPGVRVLSTYPPDKYAVASGTSQAAAFVAGMVALILGKHTAQGGETPIETPAQMVEHLRRCAIDIEQPGFDARSGFGLIDPAALLSQESAPDTNA